VNVRAPALLIADLYRRRVRRGGSWGRVINISTDGAAVFPSEVSYGATKNGLESLSRSAAHELGPAGITVNIVACPRSRRSSSCRSVGGAGRSGSPGSAAAGRPAARRLTGPARPPATFFTAFGRSAVGALGGPQETQRWE
jgi:NAD(P)-dependent dehydrogenase (short-subunit alcohol dehydrogenase family)